MPSAPLPGRTRDPGRSSRLLDCWCQRHARDVGGPATCVKPRTRCRERAEAVSDGPIAGEHSHGFATCGNGQEGGILVSAALELGFFAQSSGDDRLLSQLLGANAGALFVLFAFTRRLRAARAGRKLEHHVMYGSAPFLYAVGWLFPIAFAVALLRREDPPPAALALSASFVVLWVLSGIVLRRDWHLEHRAVSHGTRP